MAAGLETPLAPSASAQPAHRLELRRRVDSSGIKLSPGHVDVVHVMGVARAEHLSLEAVLGDPTTHEQRQEFVYRSTSSNFLAGELTGYYIEKDALQLLDELRRVQQGSENDTNRAIIFVAYELGALIVEKAITLASAGHQNAAEVFKDTVLFVFVGCFHRRNDLASFDARLWQFLQKHQTDEWTHLITPTSIRALADIAVEITDRFLYSRITLRARTISIYANTEASGKIDSLFDHSIAVLGICTEVAIDEDSTAGAEGSLVSRLAELVLHESSNWNTSSPRAAFGHTLLCLAAPHRPFLSASIINSHPIFTSPPYITWKSSGGPQILYIHGSDPRRVTEAAEQVFLAWKKEYHDDAADAGQAFSFSFCSRDPVRNSMQTMVSSLIVQAMRSLNSGDSTENYYNLLQHQFFVQRGWTSKDAQNIFILAFPEFYNNALVFLQALDECGNLESRKEWWKTIAGVNEFSDKPTRLLITSTEPDVLSGEIARYAPNMALHSYMVESDDVEDSEMPDRVISRFCPNEYGKVFLQELSRRLEPIDQVVFRTMLDLVSRHTGWPGSRTLQSYTWFCNLLDQLPVEITLPRVLDNLLRSIPDFHLIMSTLAWILCSARPLTPQELGVLCRYDLDGGGRLSMSYQDNASLRQIDYKQHISMNLLFEFRHNQVVLQQDVSRIFETDGEFLWVEAQSKGPEATCLFLYEFLSSDVIQKRLEDSYAAYHKTVNPSDEEITPPIVSDGQDILYYAVESLPYHLTKAPSVLQKVALTLFERDGPLTAWSRLYWAMQNPFSRPDRNDLHSAGVTLVTVGPHSRTLYKSLQQSVHDLSSRMETLSEASRLGDEVAMLYRITHSTDILPRSILWRAVYLDAVRVVDALLDAGMLPDAPNESTILFPSPLYLACRLNHVQIVRRLLGKKANTQILQDGTVGIMYVAAANGYVELVQAILKADGTLLTTPQPYLPIYAAATNGMWKLVETLAQLGADVDLPFDGDEERDGWRPLAAAVALGFRNTVKALLKNSADPNRNSDILSTVRMLSLAIRESKSPECVRLLLEHGADPSDQLHKPPLLVQAIQATLPLHVRQKIITLLLDHPVSVDIDSAGPSDTGVTGLMYAAASGDLDMVQFLLTAKANIALVDAEGQNALFHAVIGGHPSVVQELIDADSPIVEKNNHGALILRYAIREPKILQRLLDAGADPDLEGEDGSTAVNIAADGGHIAALQILVERGVDIHHPDSYGWTPILDAVRVAHDDQAVRVLMDAGARSSDATFSGQTALHKAIIQGRVDILRVFLEYRCVLDLEACDGDKDTALTTAVLCDEHECLRLLLRAGADVNQASGQGWTPLLYAVNLRRQPETIDLLLAQPTLDINATTAVHGAAIHLACRALDLETVTKLIRRDADVNHQVPGPSSTPLVAVCLVSESSSRSREETLDLQDRLIRELVDCGASVAAEHGFNIHNALSAASLGSGASVINYLLYKGASPQLRDPLGRPAIHFAAANGLENFEAVYRADRTMLMAEDKAGKTSLHWAAQFGRANAVNTILKYIGPAVDRKRWINKADIDGWTPLCWALRSSDVRWASNMASEPPDYPETVRCLLKAGADPTARCQMGSSEFPYTPLRLAYLHAAGDEVIQLLRAAVPDGNNADPSLLERVYSHYPGMGFCDVCFSTLYGISYICTVCEFFIACRKCYGNIDVYLADVTMPGPNAHSHTFKQWDTGLPEYQRSSSSISLHQSAEAPVSLQSPRLADLDEELASTTDDTGAAAMLVKESIPNNEGRLIHDTASGTDEDTESSDEVDLDDLSDI